MDDVIIADALLVTILILIDGFLQFKGGDKIEQSIKASQSLF